MTYESSLLFTAICGAAFLWNAAFSESEFSITPNNTVVVLQDTNHVFAFFNCTANDIPEQVTWTLEHYTGTGATGWSKEENVVHRGKMEPLMDRYGYRLDTTSGMFNLVVPVSRLENAGRYTCVKYGHYLRRRSAELIVLAGEPVCSHNVSWPVEEGTTIFMNCTLTYLGNRTVVVRAFVGHTFHGGTSVGPNVNPPHPSTTFSGTFVATPDLQGNQYKVIFQLIAWYKDRPEDLPANTTRASNALQDYTYTATMPALNIIWKPYNISIRVQKSEKFGEVLACSGSSNPPPVYYRWTDFTNPDNVMVVKEGETANQLSMPARWIYNGLIVLECAVANRKIANGKLWFGGKNVTIKVITPNTSTVQTSPSTDHTSPSTLPTTSAVPAHRPKIITTIGPQNAAAVSTQRRGSLIYVKFQCSAVFSPLVAVSELFSWYFRHAYQPFPQFESLMNGDHLTRKYVDAGFFLEKGNGSFDLVVAVSSMDVAGEYLCNAEGETVTKQSALLEVLEHDPTCSSNATTWQGDLVVDESDSVSFTCSVRHSGDLQAWMSCLSTATGDEKYDDIPTNGSSSVTFRATRELHNVPVICVMSFKAPGNKRNGSSGILLADNVPDYSYSWTSKSLNVLHVARNVKITPVKEQYATGDVLTCSGDANPPADRFVFVLDIMISDPKSLQYTSSPEFVIPADWAGISNRTILCKVGNLFPPTELYRFDLEDLFLDINVSATNGHSQASSVARAQSEAPRDANKIAIVALIGGLGGMLVFVAVVIAVVVNKYKNRRESVSSTAIRHA